MVNFKPTLWKAVVSLISLIITDLILSYILSAIRASCAEGAECPRIDLPFTEAIINPGVLLVSLLIAVLIYATWSLIQKK